MKSAEEIFNEGMARWKEAVLEKKVQESIAANPTAPVDVMETRNFVGQFVSELDLRRFPFDQQTLRIVSQTIKQF